MRKYLKEMFDEVHEWIGWAGMVCILGAYASVSLHLFTPETLFYQGMNLLGAGGILYSASQTRSYPVIALNIAWIGIALFAIVTYI